MHQLSSINTFLLILIVYISVFPLSLAASVKAGPPTLAGRPVYGGWSSGGHSPIASTSSAYSGLAAVQQGDAGQSLNLQAVGQGMVIGLNSLVGSDGHTIVAQSGGNTGQSSADSNESVGQSGIAPESAIQLELTGSDIVNLELDSQAVGWEHVDSEVEQQAQVTGAAGGWGSQASVGGWSGSDATTGGWKDSSRMEN